nr:zinc finger, CCHC-type [Tanacetum cinerariifolium]
PTSRYVVPTGRVVVPTGRRLEDKQPEEKTNMDCLVKEQEKIHLEIKVRANITVTEVPGQEGVEGNVATKKKVKESMKANLKKLLKYKALLTRRFSV